MSEQEWLDCTNPASLILFLGFNISSRKYRLSMCLYCRDHMSDFPDERSVRAIQAAEQYADGHVSEDEFRRAREAAQQAVERWKLAGDSKNAFNAETALNTLAVMDATYFGRQMQAFRFFGESLPPD